MSKYELEDKYKKFNGYELSETQVESVEFLLERVGCVLALNAGMGKTICVSIANKVLLDKYSDAISVIVCPVKALKAFKRELYTKVKYKKECIGIIATGEEYFDSTKNRIIVCTDTNLDKLVLVVNRLAEKGKKIILNVDEAHKLQDKKSKYYKAMEKIRDKAMITWLITATPILNGLDSLYNIVDFACQGFLGSYYKFCDDYTVYHFRDQYIRGGQKRKIKEIDGYKNLDQLQEKLKEIMIVRGKEYNLRFAMLSCKLTDEEYSVYKQVSSGLVNIEDDERNFSRRMHDLQRFIDRAYSGDKTLKRLVEAYSKTKYSTKEELLLRSLHSVFEKGYSVIIYADYKETIERLEKILNENKESLQLGNIFKVTGSINIKEREKVEDTIGKRDVVLITSAGTESVNLQRCNCIIFYDISFSTKTMIQAVGRVCRVDTKFKYQYAILLVAEGTIDEYKYRLFNNNLDMVKRAVGAGKDLPLEEAYLLGDAEDLRKLKDTLLWAYKGKRLNSKKGKR